MRRSWRRTLVVVAITTLVLAMAAAGSVQASNPNTVTAVNKFSVHINDSLDVEFRFAPGTLHIERGATLTFREGTPPFPEALEPHTLSIVDRADLPRTLRQIFFCDICEQFEAAHDPGNDQQPPFNFVVNKGPAGLNQPGDSLLITPDHPVTQARVTAPAGTTLHFLCAIHPWMQGRLIVE